MDDQYGRSTCGPGCRCAQSKPFAVNINPVDPQQPVDLPHPWPELIRQNFHPDLVLRAKGYALKARRDGWSEAADYFLGVLGDGFTRRFDPSMFPIAKNDPHAGLKLGVRDALVELADEFGNRVSTPVWESLGYLAFRDDPTAYASILSQADKLPLPWYVVDTCLHGIGKVYGFMLHVQSRSVMHSGLAFEHNCDCNCSLFAMADGGTIRALLPAERHQLATHAVFSHLMSEFKLLAVDKLPFELGVSPEAQEVMSLEPSA